ncbi:MAG TPA: hypothetical protein VMW27_04460, partial [Thermoanaerobaculia bacterium]|nr:hypothetical protein [Thermoanaerobaculia bacterium]
AANPLGLEILREVLECQGHPYLFGKTWTTDAVFRETRSKIQARRAEGALFFLACEAYCDAPSGGTDVKP